MPNSAVSFYRSIGPMSYLPKLDKNIELRLPSKISWSTIAGADIFYIERPQENNDLAAIKLAKDFNAKIWLDFDDLLHEVPKYNPSYKFYNDKRTQDNIEEAMLLADVITVSTNEIKDYYYEMNNNIHVIENSHNDYIYPFNKITDTKETINWRGSDTHRQDLLSVAENIWSVSERNPAWGWTFIGKDPWYITEKIKNYFQFDECDIVTYNKFILDLRSAIQIVPLIQNNFNKGKSNIGWLEGTYCGSATIAPSLPEFDKPGVINYMDKEDSFGYYLEKAIKSKSFRQQKYIESYEYIKENLLLSTINKKRLEIVEMLYED